MRTKSDHKFIGFIKASWLATLIRMSACFVFSGLALGGTENPPNPEPSLSKNIALLEPVPSSDTPTAASQPEDRVQIVTEPRRPPLPLHARRPSSEVTGHRPTIQINRTSAAPKIDGKLDDVCWQDAAVISDFTQVEPKEGSPPTERTEVRLLHDSDFLYIGVRCFDSEAEKIVATKMQDDANLSSDDLVSFSIETFGQKRSGYYFSMNAAGAKKEGLIESDGEVNTDWDAIWYGKSQIDSNGWSAEIAIPFKSLSFDPSRTVWGFNLEREIRRKQEIVRWASPFRNKTVSSLADLGEIRNLGGLRKGIGVDVKPFLTTRYRDERGGPHGAFNLQPGVDVFVRITPSLTGSLTINTDFAETEVDSRQVNLTRFPLFFPEKRDFFLQDATYFSFNAYGGPLPFYSRRIGLDPNGEVVDIFAGGKLTGRVGDLVLGLLDVQVEESSEAPSRNLSVARLSYGVLEESSIGGIFTYGDPQSDGDNWLAGLDLNYRNSHLLGSQLFVANAWLLKSESSGVSDEQLAFGGALRFPNDPFRIGTYANQIDKGFNPALGFVRRRGIRTYGGNLGYTWHMDGFLRSVDLDFSSDIVTNLDNVVESEYWSVPSLLFTNQRGDSLGLGFLHNRENLFSGFGIHPEVLIPAGDYRYNRGYVALSSSNARPVSAHIGLDTGEFYDGSSHRYTAGIAWRASRHFTFDSEFEMQQIYLPGGDFDVIVGSVVLNYAFSPALSWNNLVQYDNVTKIVGVFSRLKWTIEPGNEIYLVFKNGFEGGFGEVRSISTEVATKIVWTLRF